MTPPHIELFPRRSIGLFGAALICITMGRSTTAHAQGRSGKSQEGKTLAVPAAQAHLRVQHKQEQQRAGWAGRQHHWASNYHHTAAYRDANYGYAGNYVDQSEYNYYFRQGVQRGYADGYNSQLQYGTMSNATYSILASVLSSILGLQPIQ